MHSTNNKRSSYTAFSDNEKDSGHSNYYNHDNDESSKKKVKHENHTNFVSFLLYTIIIVSASMTTAGTSCCSTFTPILRQALLSDLRSQAALRTKRNKKTRKNWTEEQARFNNRMFYRLFRMSRPCFNKLCTNIENSIGPKNFRSERYLFDMEAKQEHSSAERSREGHSSSFVSGEMKLAITLRFLAGSSYLDLFLWSGISPKYIIFIARNVMRDWICNDEVIDIDFYNHVLRNSERMDEIATDFGWHSRGTFAGIIGALDGWLVCVKCPKLNEVENPGKYCSCKGFFLLKCPSDC